ncbi:MAG: hypothetical protein WBQ78_07990 [Gammaproteobacteria bacterium]
MNSIDEIADTSALEFSYATPYETDTDLVILIHGAGEIPNGAYTTTATSAHLAVTTPTEFLVIRCVVNLITADFNCAPTTPVTFDLTWVRNGLGSVLEKTKRTETLGPVTTKFKGEYVSVAATVNGIWNGHSPADLAGNLLDSQSTTHIREITLEANP